MGLLRVGRKNPALFLLLLILFFLFWRPAPALAADRDPYLFRFGAGVQGVFPEVGFSGVLNLTKHWALQGFFIYNDYAVIGGGKGLYRFVLRPTHNFYAYALGGHFAFYTEDFEVVSAPGFIGGLGLEFTSGNFVANLKYNLEIGYSTVGYPWGPPGPSLVYGGGIHFYIF